MKTLAEEYDLILVAKPVDEAGIAAARLEAAGIPTLTDKGGIGGGYVPTVFCDLYVPKGSGVRALAVLEQRGDLNALSDAAVGQPETEPDVRRPWLDGSVPFVLLALFGMLLVLLLLNVFFPAFL